MKRQDTADREVARGFTELLERRGTSPTDGDSEMGTASAGARTPASAREVQVNSAPEMSTSWLPPIVSLSSDDVEALVTDMLRLNADVVAALAAEGLAASHPAVAFMRVDVASRVTRWAALLLDRSRKMGSLTTGEVPIVRDGKVTVENLT